MLLLIFYSVFDERKCMQYRWKDTDRGKPKYLIICSGATLCRVLPAWNTTQQYARRLRWKCDGTRAETRFLLSAKRTSPFILARASVHSTTGSRGVRISGRNAGYTMFRGNVKGTGYPLHSRVSPSFPSRASPCAITFQLESTLTPGTTKQNYANYRN